MSSHLFNLLHLSDPTLPIGGFSHSAGLETYVQLGIVKNAVTAKEFIVGMLSQNIKYSDASFMSLAFTATQNNDWDKLMALDEECTAIKLPREIREASQKMGMRLLKIFVDVYPHEFAEKYLQAIQSKNLVGHYCIAFGMYACLLNIPLQDASTGFYYNAAVGMVTNCVKLVPLGQMDGQQLLFSLQPLIENLAKDSLQPDENMLGLCCAGFDIRCMQHEQLYSRLYMS
jgi:urease accessory protein